MFATKFLKFLLLNLGKMLVLENCKKISSKDGNNALFLYNNHLYYKTRTGARGKPSYYGCKGQNGEKCRASGKILPANPQSFVEIKGEHNHDGDHADEAEKLESEEDLRKAVKNPLCRRHEAFQSNLAKYFLEFVPYRFNLTQSLQSETAYQSAPEDVQGM